MWKECCRLKACDNGLVKIDQFCFKQILTFDKFLENPLQVKAKTHSQDINSNNEEKIANCFNFLSRKKANQTQANRSLSHNNRKKTNGETCQN
jgi:hypothetical protein